MSGNRLFRRVSTNSSISDGIADQTVTLFPFNESTRAKANPHVPAPITPIENN